MNERTSTTGASVAGFPLSSLRWHLTIQLVIELDGVDEAGEQRWQALGAVSAGPGIAAVLFVVHAYPAPKEVDNGEEIIRIISARWADKNEFRRYQKQAVD